MFKFNHLMQEIERLAHENADLYISERERPCLRTFEGFGPRFSDEQKNAIRESYAQEAGGKLIKGLIKMAFAEDKK